MSACHIALLNPNFPKHNAWVPYVWTAQVSRPLKITAVTLKS